MLVIEHLKFECKTKRVYNRLTSTWYLKMYVVNLFVQYFGRNAYLPSALLRLYQSCLALTLCIEGEFIPPEILIKKIKSVNSEINSETFCYSFIFIEKLYLP